MLPASELAGFFAAHAIWSVSTGETLIPILGYTTKDGDRKMERLVAEQMAKAVEIGRSRMETNDMDARAAVLLFDARIPVQGEKLDAIVIEIRAYSSPAAKMTVAVPYAPLESGRFLVHGPKLLAWKNEDGLEPNDTFVAFFEGVDSHEQGSKIWKEARAESK